MYSVTLSCHDYGKPLASDKHHSLLDCYAATLVSCAATLLSCHC